jgi:hypothetical protein
MKTLTQNDFKNASDYGNPAGIAVSMPKGTTSKALKANRIFGKFESYGRGISGIFRVAPHSLKTLYELDL